MQPSSSPQNPNAEFFSNVQRVIFLRQLAKSTIKETSDIAQRIFTILQLFDDRAILEGKIDDEIVKTIDDEEIRKDPKIAFYIRIINNLFKVANNSEIGAIKFLDREIIKDFDITTVAFANCVGGNYLLDILCDIANEELSARRPTFSPRKIEARTAF